MFRQVVGTILRLAVRYVDHWEGIRGSHDVPAYGFERLADPPPLDVNTVRLVSEFHNGSLTLADAWHGMFAPANVEAILELAEEAGGMAEAARKALDMDAPGAVTPTTAEMAASLAGFHFPDDLWARTVFDMVVAARRDPGGVDRMVASFVPVYFGRVASFIIENRDLTTDQAEERVMRQAREFELLKPYLIDAWKQADA
jgi:hypothetical protein